MPDQSAQDKSEQPTAERLRKARQEGQVPQSQEVGSALVLGMATMALILMGPGLLDWFRELVADGIRAGAGVTTGGAGFGEFLRAKSISAVKQIAPLVIGCVIVGCFSNIVVSGLTFSPKALKWDLSRVDPVKGFKNLVSVQSLAKLLMSMLKLVVIGVVCWLYFDHRLESIVQIRWMSPGETAVQIGSLIMGLLLRVCVVLLVIAGLDFAFQKWNYIRKMKMTKQEVKEERKQHEASPEVRGKMKQMQSELARRRMLADVPEADVVVTNPTHVAVALKYDQEAMDAPTVVAKGQDHLAQTIKDIARKHHVPIMERPVLARGLYKTCEIGKPIPSQLFVAVAELLAMVYKLRRKRKRAVR
jgi:flagellar biosynthesis protein FlhB